eukprot:2031264-Karenia_brevis.AAC.1
MPDTNARGFKTSFLSLNPNSKLTREVLWATKYVRALARAFETTVSFKTCVGVRNKLRVGDPVYLAADFAQSF